MQFAPGERCSSAAASITCSNNDSLQARLAFRVPVLQEALKALVLCRTLKILTIWMAYKILVLWTDYQKEAKNNDAEERMPLLLPNDLALQTSLLLHDVMTS